MSEYFKNLIPESGSLPGYDAVFELKGKDRYNRDALVVISRRTDPGVIIELQQVRGMGINSVDINMSFTDGDFFRPVVGMYCDMVIVSRIYDRLFPLMQADETQYLVEVYENHNTAAERVMFRGFYRPDSYRQAWQRGKAMVHISATSGLGLLRYVKFTPPPTGPGFQGNLNEGPIQGEHKAAYVLSYLFYLAGNRHDWLDMVPYGWSDFGGGGATPVPYFEQPIHVSEYYEMSCMEVLENIMENFDTQVMQVNGLLAIRMMDDPATDHYRRYNYRGEYQDNVNPYDGTNPLSSIINLESDMRNVRGTIANEIPYRRLILRKVFEPAGNLLFNGDFEKEYAGWTESDDLPREYFEIFGPPYNYMRIRAVNPVDFPEANLYYVRNNISRGEFGDIQNYRYRVSFEAFTQGALTENVVMRIELGEGNIVIKTITPDDWTGPWSRFEFIFFPWFDVLNPVLKIHALKIFGNIWIYLRNIKVEAVQHDHVLNTYVLIEQKEEEEIIELNEQCIRDAVETLTHFSGNRYVWRNRTPGVRLRRRDGGVIPVEDWKRQRYSEHYGQPRKRLQNLTCIANNQVPINGISLVQEADLDTTFVISSMKYGLMRKTLELDLLQYRNYLVNYPTPPIPDPQWILENGTWNDDGQWMDTARWHDTDPNI